MSASTKAILILGGYVTAHIHEYRTFKQDYESIRLRNVIRDIAGATEETEEWYIVSGYASRYADCLVYTKSLDFHGELPPPVQALQDFWGRVKQGDDDKALWDAFTGLSNVILMGDGGNIKSWYDALNEAQTIWKPRDEQLIQDDDPDFLSPNTVPSNNS